MSNAATNVILKCGGPQAVSAMAGVDVSNVHRWTYPKERGGTDGVVPAKHQQTLLKKAREAGIELSPDDFFKEAEEELPKRRPRKSNSHHGAAA